MKTLVRGWNLTPFINFMLKYWYWIAFAALSFISLSFLLFQSGVWTYVDALEDGIYRPSPFSDVLRYANSIDISYVFGHDQTQIASYRLIPAFIQTVIYELFGSKVGQIVYFLTYFTLSFLAFRKLLSYFFTRNISSLGALVFTFNPVSLFFLGLTSFVYAYAALPLIIIGFYEFITQNRVSRRLGYLLIYLIGLSLLMVYTRIMGLYLTVLLLVALVYIKPLVHLMRGAMLKIFFLAASTIIIAAPLVLSYAVPVLTGENKDFSGASNYSKASEEWASDSYYMYAHESIWTGLSPKEITDSVGAQWHSTHIFEVVSSIVILNVVALSIFYFWRRPSRPALIAIILLVGSLLLRVSAHFLPEGVFTKITHTYYPFLASQTNWIYLVSMPAFAFLVTYIASHRRGLYVAYILGGVYICLALVPYVTYMGNPRMALFDMQKAPEAYQEEFYRGTERYEGSTALIDSNFTWTPYAVGLFSARNQSIISGNIRVASPDRQEVASNTFNIKKNTKNSSIFNLKSIYVYRDAKPNSRDVSVWSTVRDVKADIASASRDIDDNPSLITKESNPYFEKFGIVGGDSYDFSLYSPGEVEQREVGHFYDSPLTIDKRPIVIDSTVKGQVTQASSLDAIARGNSDVIVDTKRSFYDQTRYYVKMSNYDKSKPFLLQLNKVYNSNWKLKTISQSEYEKIQCSNRVAFSLSHNSMCEFDGSPMQMKDRIDSLGSASPATEHFEGNFSGNSWVVDPEAGDDMYAILVYKKQIPMSLSFWMSWVLIGGTGIAALYYSQREGKGLLGRLRFYRRVG